MAISSSSSSSRFEKISPPTSPILRGRSPYRQHVPMTNPKKQKRARTLGRLAMALILLVVLGVLVKEWVCGNEHACFARPEWSGAQWVGGGSVIGQVGLGDDGQGMGETMLVDPGVQDDGEPVHVHVQVEDGVGGGEAGDMGSAGAEAPMGGTMEMGGF